MCDNEDLYMEARVTQAYIQIIIGLLRVHIHTGVKKQKQKKNKTHNKYIRWHASLEVTCSKPPCLGEGRRKEGVDG